MPSPTSIRPGARRPANVRFTITPLAAFVHLRRAVSGFAFALLLAMAAALPAISSAQNNQPKVSWHWHLHQPIYWNDRKSDSEDRYEYAWESIQAKDGGRAHPYDNLREIFGKDDRVAVYQYRGKTALEAIGGHSRSGVSMSYSGALMENIGSLGASYQMGYSPSWNSAYAEARGWTTAGGKTRLDIVNFSFHHALLPLHNDETVYMELRLAQEKIREIYGSGASSRGVFPSEMAFSERLIPIFKSLGIEWSIVSGEHIARGCPDFPIAYGSGGINCDPPNQADILNPNGVNFIRISIDRGCSPVAANPLSYQPAYMQYVNPRTGAVSRMIAVPADQSLGWKDGYACLDSGFLGALKDHNDTAHPSFALLAHDGDNAFGGGYSYYLECVPNLANGTSGAGCELSTIEQYLADFPPNSQSTIHVEDGAWVNADSDFGSPIFINWCYPLLNSSGQHDPANGWHEKAREYAIFTAALNRVLTAQQTSGHSPDFQKILHPGGAETHGVDRAWHYFLGSLDSGNVYFGAPLDLEIKGTIGCNEAVRCVSGLLTDPIDDHTSPTIWTLQRHPYNPGSTNYGVQYQYKSYKNNGDFFVWTFISDVSGPCTAKLYYRLDKDGKNPLASAQNETYAGGAEVGAWQTLAMNRRAFPATNVYNKPEIDYYELPTYIADHFSVEVKNLRSVLVDYYVEATDTKGNTSRSPISHVYVGEGGGVEPGSRVTVSPNPPVRGQNVTIQYNSAGTNLAGAALVKIHLGWSNWSPVVSPDADMTKLGTDLWSYTIAVPSTATQLDCVFTNGSGTWDNNGGSDWHIATTDTPAPTATVTPTPTPSPTGPTLTPSPSLTASLSPTPSTTAPTPTATLSPSPSPTQAGINPFVMDGAVDSLACEVSPGVYMASLNGWIYMAADIAAPADIFMLASANPATMQSAMWAKGGQAGQWTYFLAREGGPGTDFASWFDSRGTTPIADDANNYVHARNDAFLEGAIRRTAIGSGTIYLSIASYENPDAGVLLTQYPASLNADKNLDANEYLALAVGQDPCPSPTPTISLTPTVSPTPTASLTSSPTASLTLTATASPSLTPTSVPTQPFTPSPTSTPRPTSEPGAYNIWILQ